ncbi:MAG: hypothetical protein JNK19_02505 [Tabrizicola sp.]|nr:hypothetical protein [Tabrizicola sp.]
MAEKPGISLVRTRIAGGIWEGVLSGVKGEVPGIEARYAGRVIDGIEVAPLPGKAGQHLVRMPIPAWTLNDGEQTILLQAGETVLAQVVVIAGERADDDLRAEVTLLRAELDVLKQAFRRHCVETKG